METNNKLRLNLGCWVFKMMGYINIDIDPQFADVVADCNKLPYEDNSVDEIYAGHILEHCVDPYIALAEWKRVMKEGAQINVVIPDMKKAVSLPVDVAAFGNMSTQSYLDHVAFGSSNRKEQNHWHIFTEEILVEMMSKYFREISVVETGIKWQTSVVAIK